MIAIRIGDWASLRADASAVRTAVFVHEQRIDRDDEWDELDERAMHCVVYGNGAAIATGRLLPDAHIGRMAVLAAERGKGIGARLLRALMHHGWQRGERSFELSAQSHAVGFYRRHGFREFGEPFLEVGIEHRRMRVATSITAGTVTRPDGCRLHQVDWQTDASDEQAGAAGSGGTAPGGRRGIYLLHGLGEHSRRYDAIACWLNSLGWQVRAHDHRGHGASDGKRGVLERSDAFADDAAAQIEQFGRDLGQPPILLGHSMGGGMAAELVVTRRLPVAGLVLSSPALAIPLAAPMRAAVKLLNLAAPTLALGNGLDATYLSHDAATVAAYRGDPLVHDRACARLVSWLYQAGLQARQNAASLSVPTVLLVAGADRLVDPAGSRQFAQRAPARQLAMHWYDDAWHEIFNENAERRERVLADLQAWLQARC